MSLRFTSYAARIRSENGDEEVLDGQQRLAGIRDFFDDKVRIDGLIEPHDPRIEELHGLRYSQLPESVRKAVNRFVVQTITLTDYKPDEPNELFFRLNQAYNLTPPEKRNALRGDARDQVKKLVGQLTADGLLDRSKIGFGNGRLAYDDIVARTCVTIELGTLTTHINNNVVENFYRREEGFSDATVAAVRESGKRLLDQIAQANDEDQRVRFNKGTLQTWLIYCDWAPARLGDLPEGLLGRFEADRARQRNGDFDADTAHLRRALAEILRLYDDRASYRVTDVSSVLIRDLSLHLFTEIVFEYPAFKQSDFLFARLTEDPDLAPTLFADFIESVGWGELSASEAPR